MHPEPTQRSPARSIARSRDGLTGHGVGALSTGPVAALGETRVAVYPDDDPGGFGPALQIVTDNAAMLMDSATVLLHRLGVAYTAIMNPVFRVRRGPPATAGDRAGVRCLVPRRRRRDMDPRPTGGLGRPPSRWRRSRACCPPCLPTPARWLSTRPRWRPRCEAWRPNSTPTPRAGSRPDRKDVAALLRWLADGHFVLMGYQRCPVRDGHSSVDPSSRLGVLRLRTDAFPQLTASDDLLVLAQATMPSFLRYGAHPYIVVVREQPADGGRTPFVGLFTVAAMNANVLEIPLISRRVNDALAMAHRDPSHPGELLLDIIQTIPRSELFALSARNCWTWRWPSSTSARDGGRCCSSGPTSWLISCPAWCTCRATATPLPCGWRCRTSWSANSVG